MDNDTSRDGTGPAAGDDGPAVSPGNPCPFLRALVGEGYLPDTGASTSTVGQRIAQVSEAGDGDSALPAVPVQGVALIANGLSPLTIAQTARHGVRLDHLRDGPLDKHGAGSRVLDAHAQVDDVELARLADFGSPKRAVDGTTELGLSLAEVQRFMAANLDRSGSTHPRVDGALMRGEWPVLLKVLGRDGPDGRYLAVADVERLVRECRLPGRMRDRLTAPEVG